MPSAPSRSAGVITCVVANTQASAGPYPLVSLMPGWTARNCRTCLTDSRSPPVSNCRRPSKQPMSSSTAMLNSEAVSQTVSTSCRSMRSRSRCGVRQTSSTSTDAPPVSSMLHNSRVRPSHGRGAACGIACPGPRSANGQSANSRTVPLCGETMALGVPVVPEVKNTQQGLLPSPCPGAGLGSGSAASAPSGRSAGSQLRAASRETVHSGPATRVAPSRSTRSWTRCRGQCGSSAA